MRSTLRSNADKQDICAPVEASSLFELKNYMQNKFGFDFPQKNELPFQIAEAVKGWRISSFEFDRLLTEWYSETDETKKEIFRKEYKLSEKINEGNLAQIRLLADRYIKETENI